MLDLHTFLIFTQNGPTQIVWSFTQWCFCYVGSYWTQFHHLPYMQYVTVFTIRAHLGASYHFELCIWSESALRYLPSALYCASLVGSVSEIRLCKVWNYYFVHVFTRTCMFTLPPIGPFLQKPSHYYVLWIGCYARSKITTIWIGCKCVEEFSMGRTSTTWLSVVVSMPPLVKAKLYWSSWRWQLDSVHV